MAIHWQIKFHSLRADTQYTVNIYDSSFSGTPIQLKGGAQPFTTQEDDNEDQFTPIRTQSGYLRIVDDGLDANGNAWNWKTLLPSTDTDRPVTLTNANGVTLWQGYMQAQNFGGVLYGNPQEREFPVQCALTVLEGTDINYQQTSIQNFAYLLNYILSSLPVITIDTIVIQGNTDAQQWLLKRIDWQNFVSDEDEEGNVNARYNLFQCLEDMCMFWGWTARTFRRTLYLTCTDDAAESGFLTLTRAQLQTMAGGSAAGTTGGAFTTIPLSGDIFASVSNDDFMQRGPNKSSVKVDGNAADNRIVFFCNTAVENLMINQGWQPRFQYNDVLMQYTNNLLSYTLPTSKGTCRSGYGSFNVARIINGFDSVNEMDEVRILKSFSSTGATAYASLESRYSHLFNMDGRFALHGTIYRKSERYENKSDRNNVGQNNMYMRLGVGESRESALWFNGTTWSSTQGTFKVSIGNADNVLYPLYNESIVHRPVINLTSSMYGKIFVDFLGSDDLDNIDGEKSFEIEGFDVTFERREWTNAMNEFTERSNVREYDSSNGNNVREEFNADCIYASDNDMNFGFGVLMNPDGTYMGMLSYNGSSTLQYAEQHLADRVTTYWASAKRRISTEIRYNASVSISGSTFVISSLTPQMKVTLDGTTFYPISFTHDWWDDVVKLTLLQM